MPISLPAKIFQPNDISKERNTGSNCSISVLRPILNKRSSIPPNFLVLTKTHINNNITANYRTKSSKIIKEKLCRYHGYFSIQLYSEYRFI